MAKPNIPNQKNKYNGLNKRLAEYVGLVRQIYSVLNLEAAKMAERVKYNDSGNEFHFKDYPELTDGVKKLQSKFVSDIRGVIYNGISTEWKNSNLVQDLVADKVLKTYGAKVAGRKYQIYYQTNSDALKAFKERKDRGLNLSQKIWSQSENYKTELEYAISSAIQKGTSAVTLSKRISKYLENFKSLQKDYKEKFGKAVDCHDCEYRSIRLARSEINLAYRTAEQKRWEQMDFVVGQEIKLSNNHTCNGVPFTDICDDLKGKYPKDFKFTGWHPMCRCYVIPILKTEDEFWADNDVQSRNEIKDTPPEFKEWINENKDRIKKSKKKGTLPYFVKDNNRYTRINTPQDAAKKRHATRDEEAIRRAARNRYLLDVANVDNRMIAKLRRYAKIAEVDISEFNEYIYSHRFEESYDLITDKESKALEILYNKHQANVIRKMQDFDNRKSSIKSIINSQYEYGNFSEQQRKALNEINLDKNLKYSDGLDKLEEFKKNLLSKYDEYSKKVKKLTVSYEEFDSFDLDASTTYVERYEASIGMLSKLYGDKYTSSRLYLKITNEFNNSGDFGKAFDIFRDEYENHALKEVLSSINHLSEIKKFNTSDVYAPWISRFNDYIERINIWDIKKDGYIDIYREIEGAYNIMKLSTDKNAIKYGLDKLSVNTPWKLIDEYRKIFGKDAYKLIAKKEFYNGFDKFVPIVVGENKGAYYSSKYHHVYFDMGDRIKNAPKYALQLQYHEYGHAMDDLQGRWSSQLKWSKLFDKYADKFNKDVKVLTDGTVIIGAKHKDKYWDVYVKTKQLDDDAELAGALSDVFVSLDKNHNWFGHRAHSKDYFTNRSSCIDEFIAHASELYWDGNPIFAKVMPSLYKELRNLYKEFFMFYKNNKL